MLYLKRLVNKFTESLVYNINNIKTLEIINEES